MVQGKKQWLKPGDLRTKKLTEYEKQRNKRIKENCEIMNNLGVKNITNSLVSTVQPKCANVKEKGIRVEVDDDDEYKPSKSEDGNDDGIRDATRTLFTVSFKAINSHPRGNDGSPESRASHDRRGRGPTRDIQAHRIVDKDGKMLVPIPE
ncbi:hypothetical protein ACSBR1_020725 [Camellia fascicularis]